MLQTEYVRNLHCNYERLLLDQKPEDNRYQYCILNRGGIKGLLSCSLRYINGLAYLYYDISSKQSIVQLFGSKCITREWIRDFLWSYRNIQQELDRFLLDEHNIIWYPEQVFQDLDNCVFFFMYIPYYERGNGFMELVDFWVEHIDYEDETLVEFVYTVHDQLEKNGEAYLQKQIFEDAGRLEQKEERESAAVLPVKEAIEQKAQQPEAEREQPEAAREEKKGIFSIFEGKRKKNKEREIRDSLRQTMQQAMNGCNVAEETVYGYQEEEYGRTIYIEESADPAKLIHCLYSPEGKLLASLNTTSLSIGKKKEEVDLVLDDMSVSRMHARITREGTEVYLEDLNSTNGTFKNGLRLEPYEKRKLETEDEIRCGNVTVVFR